MATKRVLQTFDLTENVIKTRKKSSRKKSSSENESENYSENESGNESEKKSEKKPKPKSNSKKKEPKKESKKESKKEILSLNPFADYVVQEAEKSCVINDLFEYKYRPTSLSEFVGNADAVSKVSEWVCSERVGNKNMFCILFGNTGIGKSLLASLCLKSFNVINFDLNLDMHDTDDSFFDKLSKIVSSKSIDQSLFQTKASAIIIENFDKSITDATYKQFIDVLESVNKLTTPIICIVDSCLKKRYDNSKILSVELKCPDTESIINFCEGILAKEQIKMNKDAIYFLVSKLQCDFRKLLQFFKILTLNARISKTNTKADVKKILEFSEADVFYNAYEIIDSAFNGSLSDESVQTDSKEISKGVSKDISKDVPKGVSRDVPKGSDVDDLARICKSDHHCIAEMIYSNMILLEINNVSEILDEMCESSEISNKIFKNCAWELSDYSIVKSCVAPLLCIRNSKTARRIKKTKKRVKLRKSVAGVREKGVFQEVNSKTIYTKLKPDDLHYAVNNIIKPVIHPKVFDKTLKIDDIDNLTKFGLDPVSYQKLTSIQYTFTENTFENTSEKTSAENGSASRSSSSSKFEKEIGTKDRNYMIKKFKEFE